MKLLRGYKMRVIEKQMLNAIANKIDWNKDNTSVFFISATESGNHAGARSEVYLHDNHIASYWHDLNDALEVCENTLIRYPTKTTKSRLRALSVNVTTKRGVTYLDGVSI